MKNKRLRIISLAVVLSFSTLAQDRPNVLWMAGGFRRAISSVALSPDGTLLATKDDGDGVVRIWLVKDGTLLRSLHNDISPSHRVEFAPDGESVIADGVLNSSSNTGLKFWRVSDGTGLRFLPVPDLYTFVISPDGQMAAVGTRTGAIRLVRLSDGAILKSWDAHPAQSVRTLAFSPDGQKLASGSWFSDPTVKIWNVPDGLPSHVLTGHVGGVSGVAFSPDGHLLASAGESDGNIGLWNSETGELLKTLPGTSFVAFSPDGTRLVCNAARHPWDGAGETDSFRVWTTNGVQNATLEQKSDWDYGGIAFSPDGRTAVTAGRRDIRYWNTADWTQTGIQAGPTEAIDAIASSPDGSLIASGSYMETGFASGDFRIQVRDSSTGRTRAILTRHTGGVLALAFSANGVLASGSADSSVNLWDISQGVLLRTLTGHAGAVWAVAITPDSQTVISGGADGTIRLWRVSDGTSISTLSAHTDQVRGVAVSPDGSTLASVGLDHTLRFWRLPEGALIRTISLTGDSLRKVAFSHSGTLVAVSGNQDIIRFYSVADGTLVRNISAFNGATTGIAFSTGDSVIAGSGVEPYEGFFSGAVKLWRVSDGTLLKRYSNESEGATGITFSPSSDWLVYGREDGTLVKIASPFGAVRLNFQMVGDQLLLSWEASVSGYLLESSDSLTAWTPLQAPALQIGDEQVVTVDIDSKAKFFRLRKP